MQPLAGYDRSEMSGLRPSMLITLTFSLASLLSLFPLDVFISPELSPSAASINTVAS